MKKIYQLLNVSDELGYFFLVILGAYQDYFSTVRVSRKSKGWKYFAGVIGGLVGLGIAALKKKKTADKEKETNIA